MFAFSRSYAVLFLNQWPKPKHVSGYEHAPLMVIESCGQVERADDAHTHVSVLNEMHFCLIIDW